MKRCHRPRALCALILPAVIRHLHCLLAGPVHPPHYNRNKHWTRTLRIVNRTLGRAAIRAGLIFSKRMGLSPLPLNSTRVRQSALWSSAIQLHLLAVQLALGQENWGTLIKTIALQGCGFVTGYAVNFSGSFGQMNPRCDTETTQWVAQIRKFKPQAVIIEMGWWDAQEHLINGTVESLADPSYDSMIYLRILNLIQQLSTASTAPTFFLSVPWMKPVAWPNGQVNPTRSASWLMVKSTHSYVAPPRHRAGCIS